VLKYVVRRLITAVLLVLVVVTIAQIGIYLLPGDPVYIILGGEIAPDPEVLEAVRGQLGLDRPIGQQVLDGLRGLLTLDFGRSLQNKQRVGDLIAQALPNSLALVLSASLLAIVFGVGIGVIAAVKRHSWIDRAVSVGATLGISTPVFVTGSLLILLFSVTWRLVPASGNVRLGEDPGAFFARLLLPAITGGFWYGAEIARMARSCMLDVLPQDYMTTARAKGIRESRVLLKHGLRNAAVPIVAMIGVQIGAMFGSTVLLEAVFNWPGLMSMMVEAARYRDVPIIRGALAVLSVILVGVNLLTDVLYAYIDPRITYH
jgi:peptide/nickel transport system permease protein